MKIVVTFADSREACYSREVNTIEDLQNIITENNYHPLMMFPADEKGNFTVMVYDAPIE